MPGVVPNVVFGVVDVREILDLRHRILRAGLPVDTARFPGDEDSDTHHIAARLIGESAPVCCASFMLNMFERVPAWQLRGMATESSYQGLGFGKQLLKWSEDLLKEQPEFAHVEMIWCNAREPAVRFYEKNGWKRVSDVFEIPTAGPHIKMTKDI